MNVTNQTATNPSTSFGPNTPQERFAICKECKQNQYGICQALKAIYPDRRCNIGIGVELPYAHCPEGSWPDSPGRNKLDIPFMLGVASVVAIFIGFAYCVVANW